MYDAEFHVMCSEKENFKFRIENFLKHGLCNFNNSKTKFVLLLQDNHSSKLEEEVKNYENDNLQIEVMRFKQDDPSYKKFTYLTETVPERLDQARWFIGIDEDTITDVDGLIRLLDEDYDWEEKFYVSTAPMNNVQPMEYDIALLFGKEHWYCPTGGPYHEWEICCLSQKAMKAILENSNSNKVLNMRKKISKGWGDHCMGLAAKFAKIYPTGSNFISGTHMIAEHTVLGGWVVHCHHIYRLAGTNHILPILKTRQNGSFSNKKIFLTEIFDDGRNEDKGFYLLEKKGVITGPPNHRPLGVWDNKEGLLNLHFFLDNSPTRFNLSKTDLSEKIDGQNQYKIIVA